ncbi:MAG: class I adenylate-forming enzyme family protein [Actinomycetota bacterium]
MDSGEGQAGIGANLASIIEGHPGDAIALIEDDVRITYGELRARVVGWRARLASLGVTRGSRVVLAAGNEVAFVEAALATLGLGAVAAPINPYSPAPEAQRKVASVSPDLVVIGDVAARLREPDTFDVPVLYASSDGVPESAGTEAPGIVDTAPGDVAFLLSTSGVSGAAKIAMLTHQGMGWVQQSLCGDGPQQLRADDTTLAVLPVAHILGLNVALLATLRAGACAVLQRRFDSEQSLALIAEHGITMVIGAPPMWHQWAVGAGADDAMASVRLARSGAAALRPATADRLQTRFGINVVQGYGLTETSSVVTTGRGVDAPATSAGRPLADIALVVVDDDGVPVDVGDVGEVVVRTPGAFAGYLDDPESTAMVLTDDGWLWTGDLGVVDDSGFLHLVDRVKDIVIVSGFNVYPAEVEEVLMEFPGVRAAVVVGRAHGVTGETVVAHIAGEVDTDELDEWMRSQLSTYKCPTAYHLVDEIPTTSAGKALRRELRA